MFKKDKEEKPKLPVGLPLTTCIDAINAKYGEGTIGRLDKTKLNLKVVRFSSGIPGLDIIVLGGGWPRGRQIEILGEESTAKTVLCIKAAIENQKEGFPGFWDDTEGVFDAPWFASCGMKNVTVLKDKKNTILNEDKNAPIFYYTDGSNISSGNQHLDILRVMVSSGELGIAVCDSVQGIVPQEEIEESFEDYQRGVHPRLMNKAIRVIQSALNRKKDGKPNPCTMFWINQIRIDINKSYGDPRTSTGGQGRKFFASIRLMLSSGDIIKESEKGEPVGKVVKVQNIKNKVFIPYRRWEFDFFFDNSGKYQTSVGDISIEKDLFRLGMRFGFINKTGAWYVMGTGKKSKRFQGEDKAVLFLKNNPKVLNNLKEKCYSFEESK